MVWDIDTRVLTHTFPEHFGAVRSTLERWGGCSLQFSRDGNCLAVSEFRSTRGDLIRFWDLKTKEIRGELSLEQDGIADFALSPDGRTIALATESRETKLYDSATGHVKQRFKSIANSRTSVVAFSPDGMALAIAGAVSGAESLEPSSPDRWYGTVGLWDVGTGRCQAKTIVREKLGAVLALTYALDGRTIITGDMGGSVRIWDVPQHLWPTE